MAEMAVIGLGRFGRSVARSLAEQGEAVLAIDHDPERLARVEDLVDLTARIDSTDEGTMAKLALDQLAAVVVTIGGRAPEASVLTTAICREQGVPRIIARAFDSRHARLLLAIGAHEVVHPEEEVGRLLANRLAHPGLIAELPFGEASLAEIEAPEALVGRSLHDLDLRRELDVSILAIRRADGQTVVNPGPDDSAESGDVLFVLGTPEAVHALAVRQ